MPASLEDLYSRINTKVLYPPFLALHRKMMKSLLDAGLQFYATSGERTFAEQGKLFAIGREPGNGTPGKHVTNARPGFSVHNYAAAIDSCRDGDVQKAGLQPIWKLPEYEPMADAALAVGLDAGYYWRSLRDGPHVQLDLKRYGVTLAKLHQIYLKGGKKAVFSYLDSFSW